MNGIQRSKKISEMGGLEERRRARRWLRTIGKMEFVNRSCLFEDSRILDGCEINCCAFDSVGCDTEP